MSKLQGTTRNLSEGRVQALQAIINSVSAETRGAQSMQGDVMSEDQIHRISDKLGEIFGEDPNIVDHGTTRNEKGELVNDEGLPIIDINEPESSSVAIANLPAADFDDPDILPQWTLSPEEKARRKVERERILDLLELEEQQEAEQDEMSERQRFSEDLERRKQAAKYEMEDLRKSKELQKKMGRALIRSVVETNEKKAVKSFPDEKDEEASQISESAQVSTGTKKSVTFAEDERTDGIAEAGDWGDVIPARLNKGKPPAWASVQPMKIEVVERQGRSSRNSSSVPEPDSDDESNLASDAEFAAGDIMSGKVLDSSDLDEVEGNGFLDDAEPVSDWGDEQFDTASHQREVALAYHERRKTIGAQVASAMRAHTHEEGESDWDRPTVPVEATLSSAPPKPPVSRFKASRVASSNNTLASHSLGPFVVPSSQSNALSRAVRYGKLEDGKLVGGEEGDSEDDNLDGLRPTEDELIKLLEQGDITNIGPSSSRTNLPQDTSRRTPQPRPPALSELVSERDPRSKSKARVTSPAGSKDSPLSDKSTLYSPGSSVLSTPLAVTERSSPKSTTPMSPSPAPNAAALPVAHQPAMTSHVTERDIALVSGGMPRKYAPLSPRQQALTPRDSLPAISSVLESPNLSPDRATTAPPFQTMIVESPSFSSGSGGPSSQDTPMVMNAEGLQSGLTGRTTSTSAKSVKKVSRFMAERI